MAKFTKQLQRGKMLYAKDLFVKGFDYGTIADILGISDLTVRRWGQKEDFESAKRASFIALSELRNTVLESFAAVKEGKVPVLTPDQAAKYASAFEKLSDKRKTLTYMYEAFEMLSVELIRDLQEASDKDKEAALVILRKVREKMDKVLTSLTNSVVNNEIA